MSYAHFSQMVVLDPVFVNQPLNYEICTKTLPAPVDSNIYISDFFLELLKSLNSGFQVSRITSHLF
jgi:hypothetical protein